MDVYPHLAQVTNPDVIIHFKHGPLVNSSEPPISINPSDHKEYSNGFAALFPPWGELVWQRDHIIQVDFYLTQFIASRNILFKMFDREFNFPYQYIGAILHELILIPTVMLFFGNVLPIHGSAIISENKNVFIFSGTGGIGKTFLEMSFLLKDNYGFFADDIVLIGDNCSAFANYAFPKIYQYNVEQLKLLDKFIIENYGILNRIQWKLYPRIPYIGKFSRRLLNPKQISKMDTTDIGTLRKFYFLFKTRNVRKIEKKVIHYATASGLSYDVIKTEYHKIFRHLGYHKVNRSLLGIPELISENELREKYTKIFATLKNLDFVVVKIPPQYEIENLYEFIREDIKN
ncbi:MAG: hypothetical protein ACYSR3_15040 [Planctomycetota bacterium]